MSELIRSQQGQLTHLIDDLCLDGFSFDVDGDIFVAVGTIIPLLQESDLKFR